MSLYVATKWAHELAKRAASVQQIGAVRRQLERDEEMLNRELYALTGETASPAAVVPPGTKGEPYVSVFAIPPRADERLSRAGKAAWFRLRAAGWLMMEGH